MIFVLVAEKIHS